ncbi:hypothetical protein [Alkalibacter mobilis]|uniref:hypothetical protein n=1 Tax=Alkalibacter mobilis TaxID=2787712 RepID=UPI00189CD676|nr:hypothetical protein [Alkalibacter mobilis]MBF7096843.1 hypothetical protein [Alkalibacter mobilis]
MDRILLDRIPLKFDLDKALEINRIRKNSGFEKEFVKVLKIAEEKLSCKAVLRWADVGEIKNGTVQINDVVFNSKVMADNLKNIDKVFLYVLTIGDELDNEDRIEEAVIKDMVKGTALYQGMRYMEDYLKEKFGFESFAYMNPGSLPDWPIKNNVDLFKLIGNVEEAGARLNEHHYIIPWNASSGIIFENGEGYLNCTLCKNKCIKRRAPFDQQEYERIFA